LLDGIFTHGKIATTGGDDLKLKTHPKLVKPGARELVLLT
jgi:hypothetical protein